MKRVALYLRVSTREQSTEMQRAALEGVAARSGWQIVAVYEDAGISGARKCDEIGCEASINSILFRFDMLAIVD